MFAADKNDKGASFVSNSSFTVHGMKGPKGRRRGRLTAGEDEAASCVFLYPVDAFEIPVRAPNQHVKTSVNVVQLRVGWYSWASGAYK